jgi:hypothetical protein
MPRNTRRTRRRNKYVCRPPMAVFAVLTDHERVPRSELDENQARKFTREANRTNSRRNTKRGLRSRIPIPRADPNRRRRGNAPAIASEAKTEYVTDGMDIRVTYAT